MPRRAWTWWVEVMGYVGAFQTRLLLTVFFFTVAVPFAVGVRLLLDPLSRREDAKGWRDSSAGPATLDQARRQS